MSIPKKFICIEQEALHTILRKVSPNIELTFDVTEFNKPIKLSIATKIGLLIRKVKEYDDCINAIKNLIKFESVDG